jgi:GNAT superfamily N-acetyltransferase
MMFRRAGAGDAAALEAILSARPAATMFARANLREHGLGGPRSTRFWIGGGSVLGLTGDGMVLPCLSDTAHAGAAAQTLATEVPAAVVLAGMIGPAPEVRAVLAATGLAGAPCRLNADEPGCVLDLPDLRMPPALPDAVLSPAAADDAFLPDWRAAYHAEVLGTPPAEAKDRAAAEIAAYVARGSHRVLRVAGRPVAFAGFNAILPDIVQVGGVYVPPALRGRGHGRRVVALHLAEAGVPRACLFSVSASALRAYAAIGFRPAAPIALVLFDGAQALCGVAG